MRKQVPVVPRAEMLAELMRLKMGIAIAGSHGKTTTTSLLGQMLRPLDATVVVGGRLQHWNASSFVGKGAPFVIEADESDRSFLKFSPVYSIVTNIDREHLDTYRDLEDIEETFLEFLNKTAFFGCNWICLDCPSLEKIRPKISKPTKTYGFHRDANLRITSEEYHSRSSQFELEYEGVSLGEFELSVAGRHNIVNAAAAIGVSLSLQLPIDEMRKACKNFIPADRRLQIHFESPDVAVVEDYGHHPTEIKATLATLKMMYPDRESLVVFQPHRYTRTHALWNEFAKCFEENCDKLILLPIYAAHEAPIEGVTARRLAETFSKEQKVEALDSVITAKDLVQRLNGERPKVILILGAGPLTKLAQETASMIEAGRVVAQLAT